MVVKRLYFTIVSRALNNRNIAKNINKVRLTRYTLLSFIPLSLLYQFKRAANIYFLIISILSFMSFSPKVSFKLMILLESHIYDWNFRLCANFDYVRFSFIIFL